MTDHDMPAGPASEAAGEAAMADWAEQLVAQARAEGVELTGDGGLLTGLVRQVLQCGLEVEMTEHLGYERHAPEGRGTPNSRNGSTPKRVKTEIGEVDLAVPRDRAGTFEPTTVPKHRRRLDGLSGNVISLYAKGLTTGEIQAHLEEIYDTEVSRETISKITDEIVADMAVWQNRTARGGLRGAVDRRDRRQGPRLPGRQPARLCRHRRGSRRRPRRAGAVAGPIGRRRRQAVGDDADRAAQPRPRRRVDRVLRRARRAARVDPGDLAPRNGADLRGAHGPQQPPLCVPQALGAHHQGNAGDLCTSATVEAAEQRFAQFAHDWEDTYPAMIGSWRNAWGEFTPFLEFPAELRRVVYTTNAIESLNARFRRAVRHRGHSPQRASRHEGPPALSPPLDERTEPTSPERPTAGKPS